MRPEHFAALVGYIGRLCQEAGVPIDQVQLLYRDKPVVVLPISPRPHRNGQPEPEKGRGLSPIVSDILQAIRDAGKPLTGMGIMMAFAQHRPLIEWSKTAVESHLAEMMKDGIIVNPPDARPRGYRLAE